MEWKVKGNRKGNGKVKMETVKMETVTGKWKQ